MKGRALRCQTDASRFLEPDLHRFTRIGFAAKDLEARAELASDAVAVPDLDVSRSDIKAHRASGAVCPSSLAQPVRPVLHYDGSRIPDKSRSAFHRMVNNEKRIVVGQNREDACPKNQKRARRNTPVAYVPPSALIAVHRYHYPSRTGA